MTLIEFLRHTADQIESTKSCAGIERRVMLLIRDAADELAKKQVT